MPIYDYECRECGELKLIRLGFQEVEPVLDSDCEVCGEVTRHDRSYDGYAPGIGRVNGAGGSPAR